MSHGAAAKVSSRAADPPGDSSEVGTTSKLVYVVLDDLVSPA